MQIETKTNFLGRKLLAITFTLLILLVHQANADEMPGNYTRPPAPIAVSRSPSIQPTGIGGASTVGDSTIYWALDTSYAIDQVRVTLFQPISAVTSITISAENDTHREIVVGSAHYLTRNRDEIVFAIDRRISMKGIRFSVSAPNMVVGLTNIQVYGTKYVAPEIKLLKPIGGWASSSYPGYGIERLYDSNLSTAWNAGGFAPQFMEIDLGYPRELSAIQAVPAQFPEGFTTHLVYGSNDRWFYDELAGYTGYSSDGRLLQFNNHVRNLASGRYRFIRIVTQQSPSWVSWREIQIYGR